MFTKSAGLKYVLNTGKLQKINDSKVIAKGVTNSGKNISYIANIVGDEYIPQIKIIDNNTTNPQKLIGSMSSIKNGKVELVALKNGLNHLFMKEGKDGKLHTSKGISKFFAQIEMTKKLLKGLSQN